MEPVFPTGIDKETEDILYDCFLHTKSFCKVFMPNFFFTPFSAEHDRMFDLLDDEKKQKIVIAMPRGWGKTTIINLAYPAKKILFQEKKYIIPVSATGTAAKEYSENLKQELLVNEELTSMFGPIYSTDTSVEGSKDPFSTLEWVTSTGIKVMPRGAGQQIRGRIFRGNRPDLFVVDDIEDDESVESEEQRDKLKRWFFSALKNSVRFSDPNWRIVVVGTMLHEDSLLANLMNKKKHPDWESVLIELCNDKLESNWPVYISNKQVTELHDEYQASGDLDIFYREFRNIPISTENQGFKSEYFQYYEETEDELNNNPNLEGIVLADPAKTHKSGSAQTAIVGISVDMMANKLYIRDIIEEQLFPDELYSAMFDMAERINATVLAPEVTALNEYIVQPLQNMMQERGLHYFIVEVKPRQGKTGAKRSGGLVPYYRRHAVWHNKFTCGSLEKYLLQWPRPERWDVIDATAGVIFVLEEGKRYFSNTSQETEDIEKEMAKLEYMPPLRVQMIV